MGVKVKIMKPYDPKGEFGGVPHQFPDLVEIMDPKEDLDDVEIRVDAPKEEER